MQKIGTPPSDLLSQEEFWSKQPLSYFNDQLKEIIGEGVGDCRLKVKPFPHQWSAYLYHLDPENRSRTGEYSSEGCGKTFVLLLIALTYITWGNKVSLFTITSLFRQMQSDVDVYFVNFPHKPVIQPKFKEEEEQVPEPSPPFILVSYATLIIPRYYKRYNLDYDFYIFDEANEISNGKGRRFKRVDKLMEKDKGLLLVTASPYHTSYEDCFAFIKLTSGIYKNYLSYVKQHATKNHFGAVSGWYNKGAIKLRLFKRGIRRTKENILNMPTPVVSYRHLSLTPSQVSIHSSFFDYSFYENLEDTLFDGSYAPTLNHQLMIKSVSNPHQFESGTTSCIMDDLELLLKNLAKAQEEGSKVVIFFIYAETAEAYYNDLSFNFNVGRVYDQYNDSEAFKTDPSLTGILGTYKKMSRGFNFNCADYGYVVELSCSAGEMSQAMNRIFRAGRERTGTFYIPHIPKTVYDKSKTKLLGRSKEMGEVLDISGSAIDQL